MNHQLRIRPGLELFMLLDMGSDTSFQREQTCNLLLALSSFESCKKISNESPTTDPAGSKTVHAVGSGGSDTSFQRGKPVIFCWYFKTVKAVKKMMNNHLLLLKIK
jgi:hypothetical protein